MSVSRAVVHVALNGSRRLDEHPSIPRTPDELATAARSAVDAGARGHGIRTGLEDTTVLPDGSLAPDNAALVRAAAVLE